MCMGHLYVQPLNMPTLRMPTLANPDPFPLHWMKARSPLEIPERIRLSTLVPISPKNRYVPPMMNVPLSPPEPPAWELTPFEKWQADLNRKLGL